MLRWGGDKEGGGPYIYESPKDPENLIGFEVELMDRLAQRLGVRAEFRQAQWDTLPEMLRKRPDQVDIIVNGYELTRAHLQSGMIATVPYYVYELRLIARRDDAPKTWDDFQRPHPSGRKWTVGVLSGTAAEKYMAEQFGEHVDVKGYDGTTNALLEVDTKKIDATVTDTPPAAFYKDRHAGLAIAGPPTGRGYYVIYLRSGDERLRDELDRGILELTRSGDLRRIYERYGIWNDGQEFFRAQETPRDVEGTVEQADSEPAPSGWPAVWRNTPLLLRAALVTVELTLLSMPLAVIIGLIVALGRLYGPWIIRVALTLYVEVIRGTPLLLQLYVIFFLLPMLGVRLDPVIAGVLGLAINYSAYEAEIYRAGIMAIPRGQMEAALALGMTQRQALRHVIVPQAVRLVLPPVTNDFIALFKDTAVCSVITIIELTKQYSITANSTGAYLEVAAVTALLYLIMSYPLALLTRRLEKRTTPINV
jgi:polar amino acid transport system substrate-binding protein